MRIHDSRSVRACFGILLLATACTATPQATQDSGAVPPGFRHAPEDEPISWSTEGDGLLFRHIDRWTAADVFTNTCNGTGLYILSDEGARKPLRTGKNTCDILLVAEGMSLSPDGQSLVYGGKGIWRLDLGSMQRTRIAERCLPPVSAPAWSPDGKRIAFARNCDDPEHAVLHLMNPDGSGVRPLGGAIHNVGEGSPTWAPDSRRIAFVQHRSIGPHLEQIDIRDTLAAARAGQTVSEIVVADTLGGSRIVVAKGYAPAWSPRGDWIAYMAVDSAGRPSSAIRLVRPDGTGNRTLLAMSESASEHPGEASIPNAGWPESPLVWAPDGKSLAFPRGTSEGTTIWAMATDGTGLRQLTRRNP